MASWFDSFGQSVGNFVTGHGFEDNSARSTLDAQNAEKKKRDQQAQQQATPNPIIQQPTSQSTTPGLMGMPTIPSALPTTQTIVQQPVVQPVSQPKPTPQATMQPQTPPALSTGLISVPGSHPNPVMPNGVLMPKPVVSSQPAQPLSLIHI